MDLSTERVDESQLREGGPQHGEDEPQLEAHYREDKSHLMDLAKPQPKEEPQHREDQTCPKDLAEPQLGVEPQHRAGEPPRGKTSHRMSYRFINYNYYSLFSTHPHPPCYSVTISGILKLFVFCCFFVVIYMFLFGYM